MRTQGIAFTLALMLLSFTTLTAGQSLEVERLALNRVNEGLVLDADFKIDLSGRLDEILKNGVPLVFAIEFELAKSRWFWLDREVGKSRIDLKLSYNPLLRQFRITTGQIQRNYSSYNDAINTMSHLRGWLALVTEQVPDEGGYVAGLRMRLDSSQLPRPFQLSAITDRGLNLASQWKRQDLGGDTKGTVTQVAK